MVREKGIAGRGEDINKFMQTTKLECFLRKLGVRASYDDMCQGALSLRFRNKLK